ncbi:putative oxidoreductase [Tenacibaculum adriaticum]|uniref:Putative oxidoreductase n=1 Tax=Tenacibaculum adriaticum TaxID=413713 RepID=A0A5S5DV29_9FLAO|nr:aldo/keto reductase [Tenacibaculum adriaticum]TYP99787.1 putative oxidoreductase [Tenacibaculum adriaticum]
MQTKLSEIIIGCMSWGAWGKQFSPQEMTNLLQFCVDEGNTTFDHADIYGDYTTEAEFGKAFTKSGIEREQIQLISKCGIQYVGNTRDTKIKHYNYSKEYIIWSVEQSLKNLQTNYLDVLLLHRPSPLMYPQEIAAAISELQEQGKIIDFGVSNFTVSQVDLISSEIPVLANQIEFSLTQHSVMHDGSLDQMIKNKIQSMSWSPLGNVFKEETAQNIRIKKELQTLCKKYNATEDQLLLAWILKHPSKCIPVVGTTNKERIKNANEAVKMELDLEDWFSLLVASQGHKVP